MSKPKRDHWTRCAWCWRPFEDITATVIWKRGEPYCSESCAGHELVTTAESGSSALPAADQIAMEGL